MIYGYEDKEEEANDDLSAVSHDVYKNVGNYAASIIVECTRLLQNG